MGKLTYIWLCMIVFMACQNENSKSDVPELLTGNWSYTVHENNTISFSKVQSLPEQEYGISFKSENIFTQRTSGWCGTPPLTFYNEDGTYQYNDSVIKVSVNGFPDTFNWKLISLTKQKLVVTVVLSDQEKEYQALISLFDEIYNMATSVPCNDANDWLYTAFGSKACGGPKGYIAYSKDIDVPLFLTKIENYTKTEDDFNKKWDIVSTCDSPAEPVGIVCNNGVAELKY